MEENKKKNYLRLFIIAGLILLVLLIISFIYWLIHFICYYEWLGHIVRLRFTISGYTIGLLSHY
jgi:hypothetical protein